jgi:hypothetical protein
MIAAARARMVETFFIVSSIGAAVFGGKIVRTEPT